jgi:hypothetical protein
MKPLVLEEPPMHRSRLAALLLFAVLVIPLWAADNTSEDLERNARLLEKWKTDPDHYARLKRDLVQFSELPHEQQDKLRQFDRELHESDSQTQQRLWETLERYAAWLDRLPEADRQQILAIADKQERVQAIKHKREQQWLERLPAKDRDDLERLPPEERPGAIARLRTEDEQLHEKWLEALNLRHDLRPRPNRPAKLEDFPPEVTVFVNDVLLPMLHAEEKEQLKNTQGWPLLAQAILEKSKANQVLPPVSSLGPIVRYEQLPSEAKNKLGKQRFTKHEGLWPEYAVTVSEHLAKTKKDLSRPLGACKPGEFAPETEAFIKETLLPAITQEEAQNLGRAEGQWPAYPKLLHELAKKYNLTIPGMSLPGPRELWESALSASLPEVPDHMLREFVKELSADELRKLNLSPMDPSSRDRLRQEFFRRYPNHFQKFHDLDLHKRDGWKK